MTGQCAKAGCLRAPSVPLEIQTATKHDDGTPHAFTLKLCRKDAKRVAALMPISVGKLQEWLARE